VPVVPASNTGSYLLCGIMPDNDPKSYIVCKTACGAGEDEGPSSNSYSECIDGLVYIAGLAEADGYITDISGNTLTLEYVGQAPSQPSVDPYLTA
jgi:hypothetical protein